MIHGRVFRKKQAGYGVKELADYFNVCELTHKRRGQKEKG